MTTLKITIDNKKNARLLTRVLRNMKFVKTIELENSTVKNQYSTLKEILNKIETGRLFKKIDDPVEWQKKLRDEWETC